MAALILPSRRVIQPQGPVQIDGSKAASRSLSGLWIPGHGNLVGQLGGALRSDESAPFGWANRLNNGTSERTTLTSSASWVPTSGGFSMILLRRYGSALGSGDSFGVGASGTLSHRATLFFGTSGNVDFDYGGATAGASRASGSVTTAAGDIHCFVATTGPAGMRLFCDGRLIGSNTANPTRVNGGTFGFMLGAGYGGTSGQWSAGLAGAWSSQLDDRLARSLSENPWQLFKPIERRIWVPVSAGGGGTSQTVAFTLDGISAAVAQVAGRSQSLSASLDDLTFSASQVAGHSQTLAATLDGVSFSAAQSVGGANSQSLAVTLDGVQFAASQTLGHSQSLAAVLDDLTFSAAQSAASPVKSQSLAVTLDDLQFYATQEGPAVEQGHGFVLVDFEPRLWWKRKPKALDEQEAAKKIASVARQIERVAVKQVKAGRVVQPVVSKPAKVEILQAIAPQLQQMPGFDPVELYRAILERLIQQEQQRQAEQQAQQIAAQEIERIRLMELDEDETIILLMGA